MSNAPSSAFSNAFSASVKAVAMQVSRHAVFATRMTTAALTFSAGVAIALTAMPQQAHAQNQVKRAALDGVGGIVGAVLGNQVGGGRGKDAATALGAAAGVWAAESMQESSRDSGLREVPSSRSVPSRDNFGPTISPNWHVSGIDQQSASRSGQLASGTTPLSADRSNKLSAMERDFLAARDRYAKSIFASQQIQDDLILEPGSPDLQKQVTAINSRRDAAQSQYDNAKRGFVSAVEYLGQRGYDVHQYAYSYKLANSRVTAGDMSRGDLSRAMQSRSSHAEVESMNEDTYKY